MQIVNLNGTYIVGLQNVTGISQNLINPHVGIRARQCHPLIILSSQWLPFCFHAHGFTWLTSPIPVLIPNYEKIFPVSSTKLRTSITWTVYRHAICTFNCGYPLQRCASNLFMFKDKVRVISLNKLQLAKSFKIEKKTNCKVNILK